MKVILRILAMVLLVVPVQHLLRGFISGVFGNGYKFMIFGLSNTVVIIISLVMILISLYLFHITEPFFPSGKESDFK
jgi:hypothetical protein